MAQATRQPTELTAPSTLRGPAMAAGIAMGITALLLVIALVATRGSSGITPDSTGNVTDGWASYLGAAAPDAAAEVVDGWASYLTPATRPVVDGWSSSLGAATVVTNGATDGWLSRYGQRDD